jgi:hypothetical protein
MKLFYLSFARLKVHMHFEKVESKEEEKETPLSVKGGEEETSPIGPPIESGSSDEESSKSSESESDDDQEEEKVPLPA